VQLARAARVKARSNYLTRERAHGRHKKQSVRNIVATMEPEAYEVLAFAHKGAIYSGKWRATVCSVTVRYGKREVSTTVAGPNKIEVAKALLIEMIEAK
jgi:hypothetical protein